MSVEIRNNYLFLPSFGWDLWFGLGGMSCVLLVWLRLASIPNVTVPGPYQLIFWGVNPILLILLLFFLGEGGKILLDISSSWGQNKIVCMDFN